MSNQMESSNEYLAAWDSYGKQLESNIDDGLEKLDDGLENVLTGMGTSMDKATANTWVHSGRNLDHVQLSARFREDWISQKVCTIVPQDMTREWRKIDTEEGAEADDLLGIRHLFCEAAQWSRLYGTSFLVLDLKGAGDLAKPLKVDKLKEGCINSMQVVDRTRMIPVGEINYDPLSPCYGMPEHYQMVGSVQPIHYSRFLRFDATKLPLFETWRNQWYADSTLIPLEDVIDQFHSAASAASSLCQEALVDVVAIPGLQQILSNPTGEQAVMKRFRTMKQLKSIHRVLLLDSNEEYETKTTNLNSLKELIWEYLKIVAAACSIPATRFLSASPDGMNATGQSDLVNYIQMLQGIQRKTFNPLLNQLDPIICKHFGIKEYKYKWNCIFPESSAERIEREAKTIESMSVAVEKRLVSVEEARKKLVEEKVFCDIDPNKVPPIPELTPKPEPAQGATNKPKPKKQESK